MLISVQVMKDKVISELARRSRETEPILEEKRNSDAPLEKLIFSDLSDVPDGCLGI